MEFLRQCSDNMGIPKDYIRTFEDYEIGIFGTQLVFDSCFNKIQMLFPFPNILAKVTKE
jgi:hypothetical protein